MLKARAGPGGSIISVHGEDVLAKQTDDADLSALLNLPQFEPLTVRALPRRSSALSISHSKSVLYGAFVWARRALNRQKRRFLVRRALSGRWRGRCVSHRGSCLSLWRLCTGAQGA